MSKEILAVISLALFSGALFGTLVSPRISVQLQVIEQMDRSRQERRISERQTKKIPPEMVFLVLAAKAIRER